MNFISLFGKLLVRWTILITGILFVSLFYHYSYSTSLPLGEKDFPKELCGDLRVESHVASDVEFTFPDSRVLKGDLTFHVVKSNFPIDVSCYSEKATTKGAGNELKITVVHNTTVDTTLLIVSESYGPGNESLLLLMGGPLPEDKSIYFVTGLKWESIDQGMHEIITGKASTVKPLLPDDPVKILDKTTYEQIFDSFTAGYYKKTTAKFKGILI